MYSELNSKAKTLLYLKNNFNKVLNIPDLLVFEKNQIIRDKRRVIKKILRKFSRNKIIIRSSASDEDQLDYSNAGKYDSIIIKNLEFAKISEGLDYVMKKLTSPKDKLIVQLLIYKPNISGVIFTRDINTNAPYYVINYDKSGKTNLVTSGRKNISQQTLNILKNSNKFPFKFKKLISVVRYIEKKLNNDRLDIEFAVKNSQVFIFQVRNLKKNNSINDNLFFETIVNLEKKIKKILSKDRNLKGKNSLLSNMSDWNPAEIIGAKSTILSFSLYAELITNKIWRDQRKNYGYKDLDPYRLMIDLAGSPYIDLRIDLNSFLPKFLKNNVQEKAINHYINLLLKNESLHDKIEFEVIPTCYSLNSKKFLKFLKNTEKKSYINELKKITNSVVNLKNSEFENDIKKVSFLTSELENIRKSNISTIQKIFFTLNVTKKFGTLPFAGIARSAFIATVILRDLVKLKYLKFNDLEIFYSNINTITNKFNKDLYKLKKNKIKKSYFIKNYGHLRPSTYSISSLNYKDGFKKYFSNNFKLKFSKQKKLKIGKIKNKEIDDILRKNGLKFNLKQLLKFASKSIYQREYSKFVFTKGINELFDYIKKLALEVNLKYQDLEHVPINTFIEAYNNLSVNKFKSILEQQIKLNKRSFKISQSIKLPDVIKSHYDVYCHFETNINGNYITNNSVVGKIKILNKKNISQNKLRLDGYIIFIENADPGYDFLFSYDIKGLVTQYGGANSHMAIRCMELNIPAVIGIGEKKYNFYSSKNKIEINCDNKTIKILN